MQPLLELLKRCVESHTFYAGHPDCKTVINHLYRAYAESHEASFPGINDGSRELETFLAHLPLANNKELFYL